MTFYNGLRAKVRQWFDGLTLDTQENWGLLKDEFNKKFGLADMDKQQRYTFMPRSKLFDKATSKSPIISKKARR